MMRNLKVLGLALVAVLAMSAVVASAASAATFHSEGSPTIFTGTQTEANVFSTNTGVSVKCTEAHFEGTATGTSVASVTVHPTYGGCTFNSEAATVTTTGCNYILAAETNEAGLGETKVSCSGESKISVATSACTLTIGSQTTKGGVEYTNEGTGAERDVLVRSKATGITFTKDGSALLCAFAGKEGSYSGTVTTKGYVDNEGTKGAQQGVWRE